MNNKNFVIVSLPRCGTTMLCIALDHLDGFDVYGEILVNKFNHQKQINVHPHKEVENFRQKNRPQNFWHFLSKRYGCTDIEFPLKQIKMKDVFDYMDSIYSRSGIVGFKLLYPHMKRISSVIDYIKQNNLKIIHLYREDGLKQIISALSYKFMLDHNGKEKFELSDKAISKLREKLIMNKEKDNELKNIFSGMNEYVRMSYEEMTSDKNAEMIDVSKISGMIGIPKNIKSYTTKYGPKELKDRVKNFNEAWYTWN